MAAVVQVRCQHLAFKPAIARSNSAKRANNARTSTPARPLAFEFCGRVRPTHTFTARAASEQLPAPYEEPDTAKEAIKLGLTLCSEKRWSEALPIFEAALSLPGSGLKRFRDKPNEISETEKITALYNIACCHSNLGDVRSGLLAIAGCLEAGYANFAQLRQDPDLAALRADDKFEGLLKRFAPKGGFDLFGFLGGN